MSLCVNSDDIIKTN